MHFKLNLKKGWGHRGEMGWNQYSQALIEQMVRSTMDVLQMDIHRYLNEFMHLSVSKVSQ